MDKWKITVTDGEDVIEITFNTMFARGRNQVNGEAYFVGHDYIANVSDGEFQNQFGREYKLYQPDFDGIYRLDVRQWREVARGKAEKC